MIAHIRFVPPSAMRSARSAVLAGFSCSPEARFSEFRRYPRCTCQPAFRIASMEDSAPKAGARQRAEAIFDKRAQQQHLDIIEQQRQAQRNEIEKLQRLRSLRLAKDAADQETQALAGGKPRGRPRRSRRIPARSET